MAGIYTNITSGTTTTLITKGSNVSGNIKKISIANFSDDVGGATINLFLEDASDVDWYIMKNVVIPKGVTLVLDDNLAFDSSLYSLKIYNTGTSPALTIIIK